VTTFTPLAVMLLVKQGAFKHLSSFAWHPLQYRLLNQMRLENGCETV